jgi:hypothetical protein
MNLQGETKVLDQGWNPITDELEYKADKIIADAKQLNGT